MFSPVPGLGSPGQLSIFDWAYPVGVPGCIGLTGAHVSDIELSGSHVSALTLTGEHCES